MLKFKPPDPWDPNDTFLNIEKGANRLPSAFPGGSNDEEN
jgi:hypothetical protein